LTRHKPAFKKMLSWRRRVILTCWIVSGSLILVRAAQVQIVQGPSWKELVKLQHQTKEKIPGKRGSILDRNGIELGVSRERFRVSVAPREIKNVSSVTKLLAQTLDLDIDVVSGYTQSAGKWGTFRGYFPPSIRDELLHIPGVHLEQKYPRFYPQGDLVTGVLGRTRDGKGQGGIEQSFDTFLVGQEGLAVVSRDGGGTIPGQKVILNQPGEGAQVELTLDIDMQQISRNNLAEAIRTTEARGGDLIIIDPNNGDVLSMVSINNGSENSLSTITTPYEPGSTLKPFTVAGLVHNGLASLTDTVDTGLGFWEINQRTIRDVHPEGGWMSLAHALQVSSNVGIAKAAQALTKSLQYENLRDFGFGVATGIRLPGEGKGTLRHTDEWGGQSAVSLAIGYELSVTPLQMAMAYGALANGGKLYKPRIVKEVRDSQGKVIDKVFSRVVRRVLSPTVTKKISEVLERVVQDGTGTRAGLSTFAVAGKSGTTRAWSNGSYEEGAYFSSFVGFFPAEDPQMVILVKLDRPEGAYYGGATAAPVIRATMTDILASPSSNLDWNSLALAQKPSDPLPVELPIRFAGNISEIMPPVGITPKVQFELGMSSDGNVIMPDVRGLTARSAAGRIHELGLRVHWSGTGRIFRTSPEAGSVVSAGDTVNLVSRRSNGDG